MVRFLVSLLVSALVGAVVANTVLNQAFGVSLNDLVEKLDDRGILWGAVLALPIILWFVKGTIGFLISAFILAGIGFLAMVSYFDVDTPWAQTATTAVTYSLTAVIVYRLLISRAFG